MVPKELRVIDSIACADFGADEALRLVASALRRSPDPAAKALVVYAATVAPLSDPSRYEEFSDGYHAVVDDHDVWVGAAAFAAAHGFDLPAIVVERHRSQGRVLLVAAIDGVPGAAYAIASS